MNKLLTFVLLAALILCIAGCSASDTSTMRLPAKMEHRLYNGDYPSGRLQTTVEYKYDANNHLQELLCTNLYGTFSLQVTCDQIGRVLSCSGDYQTTADGAYYVDIRNTYSEDGKLLTHRDGETVCEYTYNSNGLLTSIKETQGETGQHVTVRKYAYMQDDKLLSVHSYSLDGSIETLLTWTKYEYSQNVFPGRLERETLYNSDNKPIFQVTYSYDYAQGFTYAEVKNVSATFPATQQFTFDTDGNLYKHSYGYNQTQEESFVFTYRERTTQLTNAEDIFTFHKHLGKAGISAWFDNVNP